MEPSVHWGRSKAMPRCRLAVRHSMLPIQPRGDLCHNPYPVPPLSPSGPHGGSALDCSVWGSRGSEWREPGSWVAAGISSSSAHPWHLLTQALSLCPLGQALALAGSFLKIRGRVSDSGNLSGRSQPQDQSWGVRGIVVGHQCAALHGRLDARPAPEQNGSLMA